MKTVSLAIASGSFLTTVTASPTTNRTITLPNATGTIALVGDLTALPRQFTEVMVGGANLSLTRSPDTTRPVSVVANGQRFSREQNDFTVSGSTITWNAVNAGFSLDSGDSVLVEYWF